MLQKKLTPRSRNSYLAAGKRGLVGVAVLMAVSIVFISNYNSGEKGGRVVLSGKEEPAKKDKATMQNPRYFGVDSKNRPFNITASEAQQTNPDAITLKTVQADMLLDEQKWLAISADVGEIIKRGDEIRLKQNVQMFFDGGYEFRSDFARIIPEKGYASGNQPIQGQGPTGTLLADNFEVLEHGERMIFRNNVKTTIYFE